MAKYSVNAVIEEFEQLDIMSDIDKVELSDIIVYVSNDIKDEYKKYYDAINKLITNKNRVILAIKEDCSKELYSLATLMCSRGCYDIYNVITSGVIDSEYANNAIANVKGYSDVQNYISGDITAYAYISEVLDSIRLIVESGDTQKLEKVVNDNYETLVSLPKTVDFMRNMANSSNSNSMNEALDKCKEKLERTRKELEETKKDAEKSSTRVEKLEADLSKSKQEKASLNTELNEIKRLSNKVVSAYNTTKNEGPDKSSKCILYVKELTYARYTNTFITHLFRYLEQIVGSNKNRIKLVIYDSYASDTYKVYEGLSIVDGSQYAINRNTLLASASKFVITEPAQNIIDDLLAADIDCLIIYDKMKQAKNIVHGNYVTNMYVVNSRSDYANLKETFSITPNNLVISSSDLSSTSDKFQTAHLSQKLVRLLTIPDYEKDTDSRKQLNYRDMGDSYFVRITNAIMIKQMIENKKGK